MLKADCFSICVHEEVANHQLCWRRGFRMSTLCDCVWSTRNCGKKELLCKKRYYFIKRKGVTI